MLNSKKGGLIHPFFLISGKERFLRRILTVFILCFVAYAGAEEIVARVGDSVITINDLEEALDHYMPPGAFHGRSLEKRDRFKKEALEALIEEELLFKEAKKRGLKVPDEVIDAVIEENKKRLGYKRFQEVLKQKGLSVKGFRERIRKAQMVQTLLGLLKKEASYSEAELRDYYEKNRSKFRRPESMRLYHILIKVNPSLPDEEDKKAALAGDVRQRLDRGEDFSELAGRYSEDPYRVKGGDLGFVHRGQLNPEELEEAAFGLKEGEIAGPVRTIYGFHIIKAGEKRPEETLEFDAVRQQLIKDLSEARFEDKKKDLIERLKKEYTVQVLIQLDGGSK